MEIIGHRGAMGLAPENSLKGFDLAIEHGVDWIELDVRLSADNVLMVIHDADLRRLAGLPHKVAELTAQEIADITTLSGEPIVTLEQALTHIGSHVRVSIELKDLSTAKPVAKLLHTQFTKALRAKQFLICSFITPALRDFHGLLAEVPTAQLRRWWPFVSRQLINQVGLAYVGLRHNWAKRFIISKLHQRGLGVYVYTVDEPKLLKKLDQLGVDGVVRNRP